MTIFIVVVATLISYLPQYVMLLLLRFTSADSASGDYLGNEIDTLGTLYEGMGPTSFRRLREHSWILRITAGSAFDS
ncbi:hypothetical protein ASPBRDRAFT_583175 [Aspergillus brasiliensis CBS 101740]|uniref:Uncharacterized protein n=1 Tax=Aspergillus brasiliensis (strain CBS 101740 / IMI 381727 / IBT 21946) TaxID=767769 RepID=A0A1L9UJZ9_ASPBC|nr:hypothetical protein ASPBRDRAFT_583175 [Aspergillus brasiliensis CBS 101740]